MPENKHFYYLKYRRGWKVYLKDDNGRRCKYSFTDANKIFKSDSTMTVSDLFDFIDIDPEYEKKMDEKEKQIALEKEQRFDPFQIDLF